MTKIQLTDADALVIVDVQNDFMPDGSLPVPESNHIIPVINRYIDIFTELGLPVFATRDWHPLKHCSFVQQGGPWPEHCVQDTRGAEFANGLVLPSDVTVISKGFSMEEDAYSGFQNTELDDRLTALTVERLFICGLALDVCVLNTVMDALHNSYQVYLLEDATRAVNVSPGDGVKAVEQIKSAGGICMNLKQLK